MICCRILLNLKQAADWRGDLPEPQSTGIVFAAAPRQQTNRTEMSRLEASGTRSDADGHRLRAEEPSLNDVIQPEKSSPTSIRGTSSA